MSGRRLARRAGVMLMLAALAAGFGTAVLGGFHALDYVWTAGDYVWTTPVAR
ncbi:hypothetical protein [Micromonospora musae]|uniref:hypothetical protein n=1 Tax=Micromonospora musae TaxID=1894970 RepID=UPI0033C8A63D